MHVNIELPDQSVLITSCILDFSVYIGGFCILQKETKQPANVLVCNADLDIPVSITRLLRFCSTVYVRRFIFDEAVNTIISHVQRERCLLITKTRVFKYIENFTSKN